MFIAPIIINCLISLAVTAALFGAVAAAYAVVCRLRNVKNWTHVGREGAAIIKIVTVGPILAIVYVATRLSDGIEAFIDAALPEFGRLVRRTRYAARHHAARASAAGRQSLRFDRESHLDKMAEFAPADLDDVAGERESELAYGGDW